MSGGCVSDLCVDIAIVFSRASRLHLSRPRVSYRELSVSVTNPTRMDRMVTFSEK